MTFFKFCGFIRNNFFLIVLSNKSLSIWLSSKFVDLLETKLRVQSRFWQYSYWMFVKFSSIIFPWEGNSVTWMVLHLYDDRKILIQLNRYWRQFGAKFWRDAKSSSAVSFLPNFRLTTISCGRWLSSWEALAQSNSTHPWHT